MNHRLEIRATPPILPDDSFQRREDPFNGAAEIGMWTDDDDRATSGTVCDGNKYWAVSLNGQTGKAQFSPLLSPYSIGIERGGLRFVMFYDRTLFSGLACPLFPSV